MNAFLEYFPFVLSSSFFVIYDRSTHIQFHCKWTRFNSMHIALIFMWQSVNKHFQLTLDKTWIIRKRKIFVFVWFVQLYGDVYLKNRAETPKGFFPIFSPIFYCYFLVFIFSILWFFFIKIKTKIWFYWFIMTKTQ